MDYDITKLKLVTVDYLSEAWDEPHVVDFYKKIISTKLKGYHKEFPTSVLPVDTTDFIAIHQAVCLPIKNELKPVMVFKTTPLSRCERSRITFPVLAMAQQAKSPGHIKVVSDILSAARHNNHELGYSGCWTVDPEFRKDRDFARTLREITMAMYMHTHYHYNIDEHLVSATLKFQTDKLFADYGHTLLHDKGTPLSTIKLYHLYDAEAVFMYVRRFSKLATDIADKWQHLWEQRIYYGPPKTTQKVPKAA